MQQLNGLFDLIFYITTIFALMVTIKNERSIKKIKNQLILMDKELKYLFSQRGKVKPITHDLFSGEKNDHQELNIEPKKPTPVKVKKKVTKKKKNNKKKI